MILAAANATMAGCDSQTPPARHEAAADTTGQTTPAFLKPRWTINLPAGVEWLRRYGDPTSAMLVCDRQGIIHVIDPTRGNVTSRIASLSNPKPASLASNPRWAASSRPSRTSRPVHRNFHVYDSFSVAAIDIEAGRLRWSVGVWPTRGRQQQQDPETLRRLLAVTAVGDDVLVVRDDGAIGLLDGTSGTPRWRVQLAAISECAIQMRNGLAALIVKSGNRAQVALLDLCEEPPPPPRLVSIGEIAPLFSAFTSAGLVLAWSDRLAIMSADGDVTPLPADPATRLSIASLRVIGPPAQEPALLLAVDVRGDISTYDLAKRTRLWITRPSMPMSTTATTDTDAHADTDQPPGITWTSITANADHIAAAKRTLLVILDTATGSVRRRIENDDFDPLPNAILARDGHVFVVGRSTRPRDRESSLVLWRSAASTATTRSDLVRLGVLNHAERDVRAIRFVDDLLLIVEQNRLSAYTLP